MAIIDKIVLKDNNNVSTSYDIAVKGENVSGTVASATTATKLTSDAGLTSSNGSATQPVYFSDGKPVPCTHTLGASVPANAKFTDTDTWRPLGTTADTACAGNDSRLSNARPASDVYSWAKASSKPSYTKAEVGLGNVDNTADSAKSVKYATSAGSAGSASTATLATKLGQSGSTSTGMTFYWNGQSGQPSWLWGGNDGSNMYVYNPSNFSVSYAASAGSAGALTSNGGSATQPVYFSGGKPVACSYTLAKSVPSNALFTDTNTWRGIANSLNSTDQSTSLSLYGGKLLNDKITAIKTTRKMYKVVPSASNYVSPYKFYTSENLTSEVSSYGIPIYASASGVNGVPLPCQLYQTSAGTWYLAIVAMTDYTISYFVTYLAGITDSKTY